jgi:formamidopyrimidine-DNA glycosylase
MALDDGRLLHYRDVRKFGRLYLVQNPEDVVGSLGPEPLAPEFDAGRLAGRIAGRRAPIKSLLLDQRVLAGLGNIYADEALFRSGIHPLRHGGSLSQGETAALHRAIQEVLSEAIAQGGSTVQDFRSSWGDSGRFQEQLRVFRHQGEPCPRCGADLERIRVGGRSTHFCPCCQSAQP